MNETRPFDNIKLCKYLASGIVCGMLASQFVFIVGECYHKLDLEFSFHSFLWGIDEILDFTFLFLLGAAFSTVLAFPIGIVIASHVHRCNSNSLNKTLLSGFMTSATISFLTVSAIVHRCFEILGSI